MIFGASPQFAQQGLLRGHFRRIAEKGFGDGHNAYAHSCVWFKDRLYIGTSRYVLPMLNTWRTEKLMLDPFPVPMVEYRNMDLRGQIWRYSCEEKRWELSFRAPLVDDITGKKVPLANSFRNMIVFQGKSDPEPAIYTIPTQSKKPPRRVMLRSYDGSKFEELPQPLLPDEAIEWRSFRGLVSFKGKLFAAPASGQLKYDTSKGRRDEGHRDQPVANIAAGASVRFSDDPGLGEWQQSSPVDMGDPANGNLFDMGVCGDYLYVGTLNIREGFQLWRTDGEGPAPHRWEKVLDHGADRGPLNQAVQAMAEFQGDLYLGTCIQNGGYDKANNIGPAGGEIIRVRSDGTWDLVVGDPRRTRQGFKSPTSGISSGFGTMMNGYFWRMTFHEGALYVGTAKLVALWPYTDRSRWPEFIQHILDPRSMQRLLAMRGGAELWRTVDGDNWTPVTINGFDNCYNMGIRSLLSTPQGLFVGTANFYGPKIAVHHPTGWRYEDNPRGGLEIWHGSRRFHTEDESRNERVLEAAESTVLGRDVDNAMFSSTYFPEFELFDDVFSSVDINIQELRDEQDVLARTDLDPTIRMILEGDVTPLKESVPEFLDDYFGGPWNHCVGYWFANTNTPHSAALRLIEELVSRLLDNLDSSSQREFLLVGSNAAGLAAAVLRHCPNSKVSTVVFDSESARAVRELAPTAFLKQTRRGRLGPTKQGYDAVLWIEGPSEFERADAIKQVSHALKPGGHFLASDLLVQRYVGSKKEETILDYTSQLMRSGFATAELTEATAECWIPFFEHSRKHFNSMYFRQQLSRQLLESVLQALPGADSPVEAYVLIHASKSTVSGPRSRAERHP